MSSGPIAAVLRHLGRLVAAESAADSDGRLLARFLSSYDETAFAALMQRHGPMVVAVCRRVLRHTQDAEDVSQATFLLLAQRARTIRKRDAVGSWLHGVAYRLAARARCRRDDRPASPNPEPAAKVEEPGARVRPSSCGTRPAARNCAALRRLKTAWASWFLLPTARLWPPTPATTSSLSMPLRASSSAA